MKAAHAITVALTAAILAGCGGGSQSVSGPDAARVQAFSANNPDIGPDARSDYSKAMYDDCLTKRSLQRCSANGNTGWFLPWTAWPEVHVPASSAPEEVRVIRRTLGVLNRSLPDHLRLSINRYTDRSFAGTGRDNLGRRARTLVPNGVIHAEIHPYDDPDSRGLAWKEGEKGFAFLDEGDVDLDDERDRRESVEVMVHEFLHALGFRGHPQPIETSVLSYNRNFWGELDNVPLIDVSVFHDMYGLGNWTGEHDTVQSSSGDVMFGVHVLKYPGGTSVIPWVDVGYTVPLDTDPLSGSASYRGPLAGYSGGTMLRGSVDLSVDFGKDSGEARFYGIRAWDGEEWDSEEYWNQTGWKYDLDLYWHYFDSSVDPQDQDGVPDVVGAFYGDDAGTAGGTLQRPEITAAFGAERE